MIIAVNACFLSAHFPDSDGNFIITSCAALAKKHPRHQFIFITDVVPAVAFPSAKNIAAIVTGSQVKSTLRLQYWLNYKLPAVLRKQQVHYHPRGEAGPHGDGGANTAAQAGVCGRNFHRR